jgi:osmotically-inducible protein OsmY
MKTMNRIHAALAVTVAALSLQACVPALVVGGATTGVLMAADRRQPDVMGGDERIEISAGSRIREKYKDAHVNVTSYNKTVLLTGEAMTAAAKADIEKIVLAVPEVKGVVNEIAVSAPSSFSARGNDSFITGKVKAAFVNGGKFQPNHVKVVTEAGVVYLLGLVTRAEAESATEVARGVGGVLKVVRVFEYIAATAAAPIPERKATDGADRK